MSAENEIAQAATKAASDPGLIKWALGGIATAFAALTGALWKYHGREIKEIKKVAEDRREDVKNLYRELGDHVKRDTEMHTAILGQMREQTEKLGDIRAALLVELGRRPTRDEVREMIEFHQPARR